MTTRTESGITEKARPRMIVQWVWHLPCIRPTHVCFSAPHMVTWALPGVILEHCQPGVISEYCQLWPQNKTKRKKRHFMEKRNRWAVYDAVERTGRRKIKQHLRRFSRITRKELRLLRVQMISGDKGRNESCLLSLSFFVLGATESCAQWLLWSLSEAPSTAQRWGVRDCNPSPLQPKHVLRPPSFLSSPTC